MTSQLLGGSGRPDVVVVSVCRHLDPVGRSVVVCTSSFTVRPGTTSSNNNELKAERIFPEELAVTVRDGLRPSVTVGDGESSWPARENRRALRTR